MLRLQAFKFELMPTGAQDRLMRRFAGCRRFIYNKGLELQQARCAGGQKRLGYSALCSRLTGWKREACHAWLTETHSQVLQQTLADLCQAYSNFLEGRAAAPAFKKKGRGESFRYPQGVKIDQMEGMIFLPKIGWMSYRKSREVVGEIKNATVSARVGKWFVSIQTQRALEDPKPHSSSAIGIDVGIARFASFSDGRYIAALNSFRNHERRLRKAQQSLSRKVRFSNNWRKAKLKVARIQARVGDCRNDYLHQTSSRLSKSQAVVCIEDLRIANMSRSASGTKDKPGKNVAAKSRLNKAILDQGWSEFRRRLEYKLRWNGGILVAAAPAGTSRKCPVCHGEHADNRKTQALFHCIECGFEENADFVGAINILSRGIGMIRDEGRDIERRILRVRLPQALPRASRGRIARLACQANPQRVGSRNRSSANRGSRPDAVG